MNIEQFNRYQLTTGKAGKRNSYQKKIPSISMPNIRGTRTVAEDHGCVTPPHVTASTMQVVARITKAFPLDESLSLIGPLKLL